MSYDANVLRRATQRLEEERRARSDRAARLRQEAYEKEPRLAQLDKKLQGTMSQLMAAALRRGESTAQAIQAIRAQNQDIQKERAVLLGAIGLPEDALDDKPACPPVRGHGLAWGADVPVPEKAVYPGTDPGALQTAGPGGAVL